MSVSKELRFKDVDGKETTIEFAVNAKNIQESNFTEAKVRENLKSGESVVKMLGKLAKWFTDLSKLAWSGKWADVGDKPGIGDLEGTLGVEKGGTGATSASGARTKLGIGAAATYPIADNDTTNNANYVPTARIVYEHGKEIDALSRDLGGCSFEQEGDNFYVVGADAVRKKLGSSGIGGTLETVAVRDRTVMTRNYIFNNTGDYVSLVLNVKTPPNGGNANSVTVYGTAIGTSTYKQIQKITTLNADVTVNIKGYDNIKLAVTASHSGNVGHSYEATTITTYALS